MAETQIKRKSRETGEDEVIQEFPVRGAGHVAAEGAVVIQDDVMDAIDAVLDDEPKAEAVSQRLLADIDEMMNKINAEEMVASYVQEGGQ